MRRGEEKEIKSIEKRTRWILWISFITLAILILVFYLEFYDVKDGSLTGNPIGPPGGGSAGASPGAGGGESGGGKGDGSQSEGGQSVYIIDVDAGRGGGTPECKDGKDNDNDGWIDYKEDKIGDPGCDDLNDNSELNSGGGFECSDGLDNDNNGFVDGNDDKCKSWDDKSELPECSNGKDDEIYCFGDECPGESPQGDGLIDCGGINGKESDPGCWDDIEDPGTCNPKLDNEARATSQCQDAVDNDLDGKIDFPADPECLFKEDFTETGGSRGERDKDGDGVDDEFDNCPNKDNPNQEDKDGDGIGDACDNCPDTRNEDQFDSNNNKIGDACEESFNDEEERQDEEEREEKGPSPYLIKGGQPFNPGEFTRLSVIKGDEIAFNIDQSTYTIKIDSITLESLTFIFIKPSGEAESATLTVGDVGKISIGDKIVAVKLDDLNEGIAFITIASLGVIEEGTEQTPEETEEELNTLFNSIVKEQNQVSAEKSAQQEIERAQVERKIAMIIIVIAIIIVAIVWLIVLRRQMMRRKK